MLERPFDILEWPIMKSHFSTSFFAANRASLRKSVHSATPIVIAGNGLLQRNSDTSFPFRQDSNFWYLTGIDEPDLTLVITSDDAFIMAPQRDTTRQTFDGALDVNALVNQSGVTQILPERKGWELLRKELAAAREVLVMGSSGLYDKRHGTWANPSTHELRRKLKRNSRNVKLAAIDSQLAALRVIKQPQEIEALRSAIRITTETIQEVRRKLTSYRYEFEVEAAISNGFRMRGASGHSFSPIIANGGRATVLHNVANNGQLGAQALTVVDIGAEVEQYAADITRTLAYDAPNTRQLAIFNAVLAVQAYALALLKPGTMLRDYERSVANEMGKQLIKLGLITTIEYDSVRQYYPHATSHFLGLDVHDVGDYNKPLEAGMVMTCEPGIYIPEEGIGIRIEDDVLITATGNTVLSSACPTNLFTVQ